MKGSLEFRQIEKKGLTARLNLFRMIGEEMSRGGLEQQRNRTFQNVPQFRQKTGGIGTVNDAVVA